jgi:S-formylglutathione hydrolase FrmB
MDARSPDSRAGRWAWKLTFAAALLASQASAQLRPGGVGEMQIPAPSLGTAERSVYVYLPPSYRNAQSARRRYPVVYLLHGEPGHNTDWPIKGQLAALADRLIALHRISELIVVMPDARGRGRLGHSLYLNSFDGRCRMEDFIVRDLPAWVDRTLRSRAEPSARVLIGNSDGGWAAVNLALKHPEVFGACGGLSAEYMLRPGRGDQAILGAGAGARRLVEQNSPLLYAARLAPRFKRLRIYIDCGIFDLPLLDTIRMDRELLALGVPHECHYYFGTHVWGSWRGALEHALTSLVQ